MSESIFAKYGISSKLANGLASRRLEFFITCLLPDLDLNKLYNPENLMSTFTTLDLSILKSELLEYDEF